MSDIRIKGQEVEVRIVEGGALLETLTEIQSFDVTGILEILNEGYLGETTNRRDEVYSGFSGSMVLHYSNKDVLKFVRRIIDRARRRTAGVVINIKATLRFPSGDRAQVLLKDCFFGQIPMSFGARNAYGTVNLSFEGSDFSVL